MKGIAPHLLCVISIIAVTALPVRGEEQDSELQLSSALQSLERMKEFLSSFRSLTEAASLFIPAARMKKIGNTDWETQNIGFRNMPQIIEGVLRKQEFLLRKLEYEAAQAECRQKKIEAEALKSAEQKFVEAEAGFRSFQSTFHLTD